jgi:hypothetical protein
VNAGRGTFAYAQARLQARLGMRAAPADLQRARAARDLAALLQLLRSTPQGRYVARLAPGAPVHELERRLRAEWCVLVDEVARWQPEGWRPALHWLRWLPYLPALQKLARGGRAPAWTREDPVVGRIVATEPGTRSGALLETPLQPLQAALAAEGDISAAWFTHWRRLWPASSNAGLEAIVRAVQGVDTLLRAAPPSAATEELTGTLSRRLLSVFRRHPLSPATAVAYLGLEGIDLLALRGAIVGRAALAKAAA